MKTLHSIFLGLLLCFLTKNVNLYNTKNLPVKLAFKTREIPLKVEGHRGLKQFENSAKAFQAAVELQLDGVETDLWMLKDRTVIIYHERSDDGLMILKNVETQKVSFRYLNQVEFKDLSGYVDYHTGQPLIDLGQFLEIVRQRPEMYLNLEIKDSRPVAVRRILEILQKRKVPNKIYFSSFDHKVRRLLEKEENKYSIAGKASFGYLLDKMEDFALLPSIQSSFKQN